MSVTRHPHGRDQAGPQQEEFLTVDDLARLLQVPKATIYRWRSTGHGPPGYTIGRHVRFRRAEVEAWLQERADGSGLDRS